MMFRGRREYINFTQSTAYTIVSVVPAHTILHILRAGHRKFTLNSATAKLQEVFRNRKFAVTFRTSATANAHCTSANLDYIIYCYFVLVMTFFIFGGKILPSTRR